MFINSIKPYIELTVASNLPKVMRFLDNKDPYKTKKTSIAQFKKLWYGGTYLIHAKQSDVLNIIYITMLYGIGMPILFVFASFNFLNQWICERYVIAYHMRLPPSMDDTLLKNFNDKIKLAPLMLLFNGYWMLSNE